MSNLKIQGNASGAGTTTLQSANTGAITTFTLPATDGTANQVLKTDGSGNLGFATAGVGSVTSVSAGTGMSFTAITSSGTVDIDTTVVPRFANAGTFTATQTFNGSSSALAVVFNDIAETTTISATAATGTINYDVTTQSVLYYTSNASANWTINFRGSSGTSLNTLMSTGQSVTVVFLNTNGATAYYNSAVQVDGNSVTPKYQGGTAFAAGNASSIDAYSYTIIKTASATFTVLASQTRFA